MLHGPVVSCSVVTCDTVFLYYTRVRISLIISQMLLLIFLFKTKKKKRRQRNLTFYISVKVPLQAVHVGAWQQTVELVLETS